MKEVFLSLVRHTLTTLGGALVAKGLLSSGQSAELVTLLSGLVLVLSGSVWGVIAKKISSAVPALDPVLKLVSDALAATPATPVVDKETK